MSPAATRLSAATSAACEFAHFARDGKLSLASLFAIEISLVQRKALLTPRLGEIEADAGQLFQRGLAPEGSLVATLDGQRDAHNRVEVLVAWRP
jgi:hypothetical protein